MMRTVAVMCAVVVCGAIPLPQSNRRTPEEMFEIADKNGDGRLDFDEFVKRDPIFLEMMQNDFSRRDEDRDGFVTLKEEEAFAQRVSDLLEQQIQQVTQKKFIDFDDNKNAVLEKEEVLKYADLVMGVVQDAKFDNFFASVDQNTDNQLNFTEFKNFDRKWLDVGLTFKPMPRQPIIEIDPPLPPFEPRRPQITEKKTISD